jgi:hypothetical protein
MQSDKMFSKTVSLAGIEVVFRNSIANASRYRKFEEMLLSPEEINLDGGSSEDFATERMLFCLAVSHMESIRGIDWTIPDTNISKNELRKSFNALIKLIPYQLLFKWNDAVNELSASISGMFEKPESELTPEQLADPNS